MQRWPMRWLGILLCMTFSPDLVLWATADVSVPTRVALTFVARRQLVPALSRQSVQIVDHSSGADRQLTHKLLCGIHSRAVHIHESEFTLVDPQYSYVGDGTDAQVTELFVFDLPRGIPCAAENHGIQFHAHGQELTHHV